MKRLGVSIVSISQITPHLSIFSGFTANISPTTQEVRHNKYFLISSKFTNNTQGRYKAKLQQKINLQLKSKEASTVLRYVIKHAGSGASTTDRRVFLPTSWVLSPLPECFITEQSTVEAFYLFYGKKIYDFLHKFSIIFKTNSADGVSIRELRYFVLS